MFVRRDWPTITSGRVVRYELECGYYDGEINASRDGVSIDGRWPIMQPEQVEEVRRVLDLAARQAEHIGRTDKPCDDEYGTHEEAMKRAIARSPFGWEKNAEEAV